MQILGESREQVSPDAAVPRSRQMVRTEATRAALLAAAELVFSRDGFEASRIEDIALEAGRTRGAFYANFDSKTAILLALRSIAFHRRKVEVRELLAGLETQWERERAVALYLLDQIQDKQRLLLQLEFKLFAIRRPEMRAELAQRHLDAGSVASEEELPRAFALGDHSPATQRRRTLMVESLLEGFAVNALFSPEVMDAEVLAEVIPRLASTLVRDWMPAAR
jgi:AcrR family transcriptional regulator